jgi:type I restriction-modification system DNA methylase subunit
MKLEEARKLVTETFTQAFDRARFLRFVQNVVNHLDTRGERQHRWSGNGGIKQAFRDKVRLYERLGTYTDPDGEKIDVLAIHLARDTTLERGRTFLRNFVADYLTTGHGNDKSAVLAAFVSPDESDWRFSFVKLEYALEQTDAGRVRERKELTPARRYSFIVGSNEHSHTAQRQFLELLENDANDPTLAEIEKAFDIEKVTKEFFARYKELFESVRDALDAVVKKSKLVREEFERKGIEADDFAKKLLGQLVFLYFLQRKGWFGVRRDAAWGTGDRQYLRHLFDERARYYEQGEHGAKHNFFNDILESLFYNTLATPRRADYSDRFFCKIPFLNGGLFEPLFDYDWVHTDILLPDTLFSNSTVTKDGDRGTGILDVFDRYNFTVNEAEPLERDVAVDPEMLGKVFENLLPENLRHKGGTYYTPRVIVNYMCQQSLINYLSTHLAEVPREDLDTFIRIGYAQADFEAAGTQSHRDKFLPETIRRHAPQIDRLLEEITVCDPAIGSGAFPVGMMQEIVRARLALSSVEGVPQRTTYELKRHAIQNSLYGVDIDPGAVEIAKLRLWLSLVVDEESRERIQALPNLDYKIMQGNSLLEEFRGVKLLDDDFIERNSAGDDGILETLKGRIQQMRGEAIAIRQKHGKTSPYAIKHEREIDALLKQVGLLVAQPERRSEDLFASESKQKLASLKECIERYTNETSPDEKVRLRDRIEQLEWEFMAATLEEHGETEALAELARHRRDNRKNYFLWKLHFAGVFQEKGGFDVVIGNPPYVRQEEIKELKPALQRGYQTYTGTSDLYIYFYERAVQLLNAQGAMAFITSNKYFRAAYGEKLRRLLSETTRINQIIDFGDAPVFEATAYACVIMLQRQPSNGNMTRVWNLPAGALVEDFEHNFTAQGFALAQSELKADGWRLESPVMLRLLEKLRRIGKPLCEYVGATVYRGITTGFNEAFVVDRMTYDALVKEHPSSKGLLKPFLRGRDVKRWHIQAQDLWLIFIPWHFPLHEDSNVKGASLKAEKEFARYFPAIYKHLLKYKNDLSMRNATETGIRYEWYALQRWASDYWQEFEKPKIVSTKISIRPTFTLDTNGCYLGNTSYFLPTLSETHYLLALLNSYLFHIYAKKIFVEKQGGWYEIQPAGLESFPIPAATLAQQAPITKLVDRILAAKRDDPQADTSRHEREIDRLVYQLYELTDDEIAIVEGTAK